MLEKNIEKNVDELLERKKSSILMKEVFAELKYTRASSRQYFISIVISLILGGIACSVPNTVEIMGNAIEILNSIDVAFLAMVVGAYAIFQALLTDDFIMALIMTDNNLLKISNKSFLNLIMLFLGAIVLNTFLLIIYPVIPVDWVLFDNILANNICAGILCIIYFFGNFMIILEIKNFGINLFKMFNSSNAQRVINQIMKDQPKERDGQ